MNIKDFHLFYIHHLLICSSNIRASIYIWHVFIIRVSFECIYSLNRLNDGKSTFWCQRTGMFISDVLIVFQWTEFVFPLSFSESGWKTYRLKEICFQLCTKIAMWYAKKFCLVLNNVLEHSLPLVSVCSVHEVFKSSVPPNPWLSYLVPSAVLWT